MPQMSPMNWLVMFNMFYLTMIMTCITMNFIKLNTKMTLIQKKSSKKNMFQNKW